jgi:replicative DNA helicase
MGGQRSNQLTYTAAEAMKGTDGNPGVVERIETRLAEPEYTEGYRFGWPELEALVGGLVPGHLIVVMADTSVGKSAFVQNLAWQLAKAGKRSWIWSSEMDHIEVTQRITAMEAGLNIRAFDAENSPSPAQLHAIRAAEVSVASLPISIMPMARAQLKTVAAEARRQCSNGAEVVFLDHLQHLRVQGMQGTAMWEEIAAIVKEIAMLNRVPVVAVNHVNRDSAREGITMHSGKNSSAWEQDANDMIILETVAYEVGHWRTLTESETNAQLAEHRWVKVRARTPKVREGGLGYCVRVLDWNKGGRYVPLSEEYRG